MQSQKTNRFASFEVAEDAPVAAPVKQQQQKPKAPAADKQIKVKVVKQAQIVDDGQGEFVEDKQRPQTAGGRGGRGGQGGRGRGEGRQGGEKKREHGERPGGNSKGGERGRGRGRPRTARVEGDEGADVERAEAGGHRNRYAGKARESDHPFDRKDGTGKAHRGDRKEGGGKGGWGGQKRADEAQVDEAAGDIAADKKREERRGKQPDRKERAERRERKQRAEEEEKKEKEVVESEEEVGFTLDDYFTQQAAKSTGVALSGQVRGHEKTSMGKAEESKDTRGAQFQTTYDTSITGRETHTIKPGQGAELLSFQAADDDADTRPRRGGQQQKQQQKGGRKGKMVIDDNDFPAL